MTEYIKKKSNKSQTQNYYKQYKFNIRCKICGTVFGKGYSKNFRNKTCMKCEQELIIKKELKEKQEKLKK